MSDQQNRSLIAIAKNLMLDVVPSYANKVFYSLGFLSMTSLFMLVVSGMIMVFKGSAWWFSDSLGIFVRSVHLWSAQAFVLFVLLHLLIVFLTSGYRSPRRFTWVIGASMLFLALMEAEFGYGLRGDFSSQWRALQASDLYNGSGLGHFINNLNYAQIYGIHIMLIPLVILGLLFVHYFLVKTRGIAKPFKQNAHYQMTHANHAVLFARGGAVIMAIIILARIFPSPTIAPVTIQDVATSNPQLLATTLIAELERTSDTATYLDSIDPYTYDTAQIYVFRPLDQETRAEQAANPLSNFQKNDAQTQTRAIADAKSYFNSGATLNSASANPVIAGISMLVRMAQSGLYEPALRQANATDQTYVTRFLSDTGVLDSQAQALGITTEQYGMLREERGSVPPGAWWLAPLGLLDHTILANDPNQDRDGALILGSCVLLLIAFPYIPFINRIPEFIGLDQWIWKTKR